jgi:hypothetical protein
MQQLPWSSRSGRRRIDTHVLCRRFLTRQIQRMINRGDFADCSVVALRDRSGIGVRLRLILGAMIIAEAFGAKFKFHWPLRSSDGIYPVQDMFDGNFVEKYHLPVADSMKSLTVISKLNLFHVAFLRKNDGLPVSVITKRDSFTDAGQLYTDDFDLQFMTLSDAVRRLRFHSEIERVRDYVDSILPRFNLAIHLRRGDIAISHARIGGSFAGKCLPLPLVRELVARVGSDKNILLVGQDNITIQHVKAKLRVHTIDEFTYPGEKTPLKDDMFDFFALTKCDAVIGGRSNFSLFAAQVGGSRRLAWRDFIRPDELKNILMRYIEQPTIGDKPIEVALASEFARHEVPELLTVCDIDFLLSRATESDPENPVYPLRVAADFLRKSDQKTASQILSDATKRGALKTTLSVAEHSRISHPDVGFKRLVRSKGFLRQSDWSVLEDHSSKIPWVDYYLAMRAVSQGDETTALRYFQLAADALPDPPREWFDAESVIASACRVLRTEEKWNEIVR